MKMEEENNSMKKQHNEHFNDIQFIIGINCVNLSRTLLNLKYVSSNTWCHNIVKIQICGIHSFYILWIYSSYFNYHISETQPWFCCMD